MDLDINLTPEEAMDLHWSPQEEDEAAGPLDLHEDGLVPEVEEYLQHLQVIHPNMDLDLNLTPEEAMDLDIHEEDGHVPEHGGDGHIPVKKPHHRDLPDSHKFAAYILH
jgi:hypothetical protein